ncbi:MAG: AGE family epimerase/isomerase [Saprospiraceae bacterium]|nr:AGE family epimerase/isomerase [Saprospiraceae bacterium]
MQDQTKLTDLKHQYRQTLLTDVVPFWMVHSPDFDHGGYFTCLDRSGTVYDTDKFIWLQCRQVWLFSMLYNQVERNREWLRIAELGASFLEKYGRDSTGNWYFALNREGKPLVQPYNIFSDCFAAMAFAQFGQATGNMRYYQIALQTFKRIMERRSNPKGVYEKSYPGTRPMKGLALPMILSNLVLEIEHLLDDTQVQEVVDYARQEVMQVFYQQDLGLILENVGLDGRPLDTFDGRLVSPGHSLESMWFLMDIGVRLDDKELIDQAKDIALDLLAYGWDQQFGGIYYFMDYKGAPLDRLDWDQKLWWVHQEAILAMLKGYALTLDQKCWAWFEKIHDYTWTHFPDPSFGEWYGYLNREGEVLLDLKGGKWKGCFHTPRFLFQGWKTLTHIEQSVN